MNLRRTLFIPSKLMESLSPGNAKEIVCIIYGRTMKFEKSVETYMAPIHTIRY